MIVTIYQCAANEPLRFTGAAKLRPFDGYLCSLTPDEVADGSVLLYNRDAIIAIQLEAEPVPTEPSPSIEEGVASGQARAGYVD